jgi:hypothetical protein
MGNDHRVRLLIGLFHGRFFENDSVSPGGGFQTNIAQVLGFLIAAGLFVAYLVTPSFLSLSLSAPSPETEWALRSLRVFFPAYSFAVVGFATVFEWDTLFPDRRDFLILTPLPIRLRELCAAKIAALARFLLLLTGAVNLIPNLMVIVFSLTIPQLRGTGFRLAAAQICVTATASLFAFFGIAAFEGLLMNISSPRIFLRVSPWIQMIGMSVMVLGILTYPIYSLLLERAVEARAQWPWLFPPIWFSGLYDLIIGGPNQPFADLGKFGLKMLGASIVVFSLTWAIGFRLHYRRTLEALSTPSLRCAWTYPNWLIRPPLERAIFDFSGKTLARSQKHQFFLATYLSIGLSIGLLFAASGRDGRLIWSQEGVKSLPFIIAFFAVSGFRAVFQFPADLASNWLFRVTEAKWAETSGRATRKRVLATGLAPVLLLAGAFETFIGERQVPVHLVFQLLGGALLTEIMFWSFDKIPFTCSYFPGRTNLAILAVFYLYGFTAYGFNMADLESASERHLVLSLLCFASAAILLRMSWRRTPQPSAIRFDGDEPVIQTLDLS